MKHILAILVLSLVASMVILAIIGVGVLMYCFVEWDISYFIEYCKWIIQNPPSLRGLYVFMIIILGLLDIIMNNE